LREAALIAQQLDSGNAGLAGQRLRADLYQLQRSPEEAKQLVKLVEQYDRKGSGADLEIRQGRQNGYSVANASIVDYDYYRDSRTGRVQRQAYSNEQICTIILGQNGSRGYNDRGSNGRGYNSYDNHSSYNGRQTYDPRGSYDTRRSFDPRGSYDQRQPFDPRASYDPRSPQFDPRTFDPRQTRADSLRFDNTQFDPRNFDPRRYFENNGRFYQQPSSRYEPNYTQNDPRYYNPAQRVDPRSYDPDYEQSRNRSRRVAPQHNHQHDHGEDNRRRTDSHRSTAGVNTDGLDRNAAEALDYAKQLAERNGVKIQVTSAFRTHADQSRLYAKLNGISPVAKPGSSSHEFGEAIDVKNFQQAKPYLVAAGFVHGDGKGKIAGDPWHFRYLG